MPTAGSIVASLKATDSQSGSAELATSAELISTSGAPTNAVVGAAIGSPMLAKAWCYFTSNIASYNTSPATTQQTVVTSSTFNIAAGIHTTDGSTTTTGGVQQTATGTYKVTFTTALPNTNYIVTGSGQVSALAQRHAGIKVTSKTTTHFIFQTTSSANTDIYNVAEFQLVVFGLMIVTGKLVQILSL